MCMLNNKFSFWAIMEYFCLHTFHEENIVQSYYYITCILVVLTQTWLFLVPFLKVHVLETLECSAGICLRNREYMIMNNSGSIKIWKALYWYLTFPLNFVSERTRLKTFSLPLTLKLEACLSFIILIQKLIDLFIRRNSIFQVFVKHYIFHRTLTYLRLHNTIVHSPHSIQGHFTIQVNGSC